MSRTMYTTYDAQGRVIAFGSASNPEEQAPESGGVFLGGQISGDDWWFDDSVPTARPEPDGFALSAAELIADGEATLELTGVPAGATVTFGGQTFTAEGGPILLDTDHIGENRVTVEAFPMKPWTGSFVGTPPEG